jgi:hypothetical protein
MTVQKLGVSLAEAVLSALRSQGVADEFGSIMHVGFDFYDGKAGTASVPKIMCIAYNGETTGYIIDTAKFDCSMFKVRKGRIRQARRCVGELTLPQGNVRNRGGES